MQLTAFSESSAPFEIFAEVRFKNSSLRVDFSVKGAWTDVRGLGETKSRGERRNELWKTTCFEFFLKIPSEKHYWEFNLNPNGDWNFYRLRDYRQDLQPEAKVSKIECTVDQTPKAWSITAEMDLSSLSLPENFDLNLTAVIENLHGEKTYWALAHSAPKPDFHDPRQFVLQWPRPQGKL